MSQINVNTIRNRTGGPPNLDKGAVVTGILTCTGNVSVGGTLTYEDVTNIDSTGIVTAKSGIFVGNPVSPGIGATINPNGNAVFAGIVTASSFSGIEADKIFEGNTEVETIDTGSDGHVKMTTEGSERVRVGPAGQIGLGGANYGTAGQLLTSGGSGSAVSWSTVDAAPQVKLNASGSIAAGKPIVVNTDGTASQVVQTTEGLENPVASDSVNFFGNQINFPTAVYAASLDRIIVAQMEGNTSGASHVEAFSISDKGVLNAHGISGTQYSGSDQYSNYSITWDSTNSKFVLCYTDRSDSNKYKARVGSLGGSDNVTITIGSAVDTGLTARNGYNSGGRECDVVYDSNSGKIVVATANSSNNAISVVGTVSGTSITFGTPVTILTGTSDDVNLAFDSSVNKIVAVVGRSTSDWIYSYVGTVSGNSITWGTYQVVEATQNGGPPSVVYMTEQQKVFVAFDSDGFRAHCKIGTVSGNSITWGARTDCGTNDTTLQRAGSFMHCAYDTYAKLPAVAWRAAYSGDVLAVSAAKSISGTTATFGNIITAEAQGVRSPFVCDLNKPGGVGIFYRNQGASGQAKYRSVDIASQTTNVTAENYIGVSDGNYTNGQEATIKLCGNTDNNQVGLTTGQNYFVQNNGTISLTAGSPQVFVGNAVSATKLALASPAAGDSPGLVHVAGVSAPNSAYVTFENLTSTNISSYLIRFNGITFTLGSSKIRAQLQFNGTWEQNTVYMSRSTILELGTSSAPTYSGSSAGDHFNLQDEGGYQVNGEMHLPMCSPTNNNSNEAIKYFWCTMQASNYRNDSHGRCDSTESRSNQISGIRFRSNRSNDNLGVHGRIDLYKYTY